MVEKEGREGGGVFSLAFLRIYRPAGDDSLDELVLGWDLGVACGWRGKDLVVCGDGFLAGGVGVSV